MFDPLYDEIVANSSEILVYIACHVFIELILPLSIFVAVILTIFLDWSWMPISTIDRQRGKSLEEIKKNLFE
tara:strand:+ start:138 stop:353 length:216 start_codon:yes stop_codon:yes gene_type:complete